MKDRNIEKSIKFLEDMLDKLINKKIDIDKLTITKSLRGYYKFPERIAHKVLADRVGLRDPGNKPRPGDRIPFVYINTDKKKDLQGNKIELPNYIKENNLNIDYGFYITNQIMKPILQLYSLIIFDIKKYNCKSLKLKINTLKQNEEDKDKLIKKIQNLKEKEIEKLLFTKYTRINDNNIKKNTMITTFFSKID
jgi:DNA polymerase elongation subunit (family B)